MVMYLGGCTPSLSAWACCWSYTSCRSMLCFLAWCRQDVLAILGCHDQLSWQGSTVLASCTASSVCSQWQGKGSITQLLGRVRAGGLTHKRMEKSCRDLRILGEQGQEETQKVTQAICKYEGKNDNSFVKYKQKFFYQNSGGGGPPASQSAYYRTSSISSFRKFGNSGQFNHLLWFSTVIMWLIFFR